MNYTRYEPELKEIIFSDNWFMEVLKLVRDCNPPIKQQFTNMPQIQMHQSNFGSEKILKKIGMQKEGCLRKHMWCKGNWRD